MNKNEAKARIKINRLLEDAGWRFYDDENGRANIQLEQGVSITKQDINSFGEDFESLSEKLMFDYKSYSIRYKRVSKDTGKNEFDSFYPAKSKSIIDEIDKVLAEHYGFTQEELDFIINYDIKYRMGKELNN